MAAVAFINPKGGSGKTTLAMVLAQEFSRRGGRVAVIDADPNGIIRKWAESRRSKSLSLPFEVHASPSEQTIARDIERLSSDYDLVLIDLEGTASRMTSRAMSRAHLILIPLNPSPIDAGLAATAVELVEEESHTLQRNLNFRLVRSRDNTAVRTKSARRIASAIEANELPMLDHGLVERAAYRDIFEFSKTLEELDASETSGLNQARLNAQHVADAVLQALKTIEGEGA